MALVDSLLSSLVLGGSSFAHFDEQWSIADDAADAADATSVECPEDVTAPSGWLSQIVVFHFRPGSALTMLGEEYRPPVPTLEGQAAVLYAVRWLVKRTRCPA